MTIEIINNRNNVNILSNLNTFNANIFKLHFYFILVLASLIRKLDFTYHTSDRTISI